MDFRIGLDDANNARIALIYSGSPLYAQGVRRGWIVKKINDTDVAPDSSYTVMQLHIPILSVPSQAGVTNIFLFQKPDGTEDTITSTKSSFTIEFCYAVLIHFIFQQG